MALDLSRTYTIPFSVATGRRQGILTNDRSEVASLIVVGEAPIRDGRQLLPALHPGGASGKRLLSWMGCSWEEFSTRAASLNLLPRPCGSTWTRNEKRQARATTELVRAYLEFSEATRMVLLGARVAEAFALAGKLHSWYGSPGQWRYALAAHPSGRSLYWNDPNNRKWARAWWYALWQEVAA